MPDAHLFSVKAASQNSNQILLDNQIVYYNTSRVRRFLLASRTIFEAARSILNPTKLSTKLCTEACNTAVYILNRTVKLSVNNNTPYEL